MKIIEVTANKIEYIWAEGDFFDEDEHDRDAFYRESYALATASGMNILRDNSPSCYAVSKGHAVGCLFVKDSNDKYSFDIVVSPKFQNQGIGSKLADFAVQEYNQRREGYDNYDYSIDVINPSMKSILLKKGFVVLKDLGPTRWLMGKK
jgi:ribosomal protein S18 acetylase RimI-like enzyme